MFTFYADDSGTSPDQPVAIATVLIVPNAQIPRLENEWTTLKEKEGFSFFHTSEFVHRNPKSEFADWAKEKQEGVLRRPWLCAKSCLQSMCCRWVEYSVLYRILRT
jgi:hypothetical protein